LQVNDVASFERFIAQLTPFYSHPSLSKSPLRPRLTGLYLLLLLSRNEIGSFHTLIETLSADVDSQLMQDQLVKFPIELEKCLMEGSFTKIWNASNEPPSPEYKVFLQDLMATVRLVFTFGLLQDAVNLIYKVFFSFYRNEIASCGEKAYTTLPIRDAATLLFYTELNDVLAFASKVSQLPSHLPSLELASIEYYPCFKSQRKGWIVNPTTQIISFTPLESKSASNTLMDREKIIQATLGYAQELETIV